MVIPSGVLPDNILNIYYFFFNCRQHSTAFTVSQQKDVIFVRNQFPVRNGSIKYRIKLLQPPANQTLASYPCFSCSPTQ